MVVFQGSKNVSMSDESSEIAKLLQWTISCKSRTDITEQATIRNGRMVGGNVVYTQGSMPRSDYKYSLIYLDVGYHIRLYQTVVLPDCFIASCQVEGTFPWRGASTTLLPSLSDRRLFARVKLAHKNKSSSQTRNKPFSAWPSFLSLRHNHRT
jgi:hypothetical protein